MRILLIEDDPSLGSSLQSWLQMDGYAVDWLQRGDQAATALATHAYQCVLLDRGLLALTAMPCSKPCAAPVRPRRSCR